MYSQNIRTKILIIGCDFPTFQIYWRVFANAPESDVVGFIHVLDDGLPPVHQFKGNTRLNLTVYPHHKLEKVIAEHKVQKCYILTQNNSMARVQSIIHRILSTGRCSVEFLRPGQASVRSFKPVICITSLSKQVGKTQMSRFCTMTLNKNMRRVAVIIPIFHILPPNVNAFSNSGEISDVNIFTKVNNTSFEKNDANDKINEIITNKKLNENINDDINENINEDNIDDDVEYEVDIDSIGDKGGYLNSEMLMVNNKNMSTNNILKGSRDVQFDDKFKRHVKFERHDQYGKKNDLSEFYRTVLTVEQSPHFEFSSPEEVQKERLQFSQDVIWQIQNYFSCGAYRVYVTSDIRRAMIQAEQHADIIVYDSFECETPFIKSPNSKICVCSISSLTNVRSKCNWPGLVNLHLDPNVAIVTEGLIREDEKVKTSLIRLLKKSSPNHVFFVNSNPTIENSSGLYEIFNKKVLTIGVESTKTEASKVALQMGCSEVIDPSPFLYEGLAKSDKNVIIAPIPTASSPTRETELETTEAMEKIAKTVNKSDADVIIVSLPNDIPGIDITKQVLYTTSEIVDDNNNSVYNWLSQFFIAAQKPPLQNHFEAQVDILMSMAESTDKELYVTNNTSANREALCRLFLSSHLPPGFRVTTGEIIDASLNITGQLDVVIVNETHPYLTVDNTNSVIAPILADSVLAVLEVKTSMTCETLKKALSQLRPVKALMPMHGTLESPDGQIIEDPLGGKIITGIFAFNPANEIDSKISEIIKLYPNVADFIVLPDAFGYFNVETMRVCGFKVKNEDKVVNGYVRYSAKGMGLAIIFGMLNSINALRRFSGSNCLRYLSGCWGGRFEQVAKMLKETEKNLSQVDKIISMSVSGSTDEQRETFTGLRRQLNVMLEEVKDQLASQVPPANSNLMYE